MICRLTRHPLTRWRKRLGPDKIEELLAATIDTAKEEKLLTEKHVERVNVDTTVQEKAIAFPTDARLYHKARRALVKLAKKMHIDLRQNYERTGRKFFSNRVVMRVQASTIVRRKKRRS